MNELILEATSRELIGKKAKKLLKQGIIPAVIYGHKIKPQSLSVNYVDFKKLYEKAGESTIIDLKIGQKSSVKALIQDIQFSPKGYSFVHIDFHQVEMDEKLHTEVGLKFFGESKAVKEMGGTLIKNIDSLNIECLPKDLVHEIEVDISSLDSFDKSIKVKDINIPQGIKVLDDKNEMIAIVEAPRVEEVKKEEEKPSAQAAQPNETSKAEKSS